MTKDFYILKRKTEWIFVHLNDITHLAYYPKHKERNWTYYPSINSFHTFDVMKDDYDVNKDPYAKDVPEKWIITLREGEINLTQKEYNDIKKWIEELER